MAQGNDTHAYGSRPSFRLKLVGRIALVIGVASLAVLVAFLLFISGTSGDAYREIIRSHSITRHSLGPGMLLAGSFLAGVVAIVTWLISLYAASRVAGPLFRLSRNLENLIRSRYAGVTPIREEDQLQEEARQLKEAADRLKSHYREVAEAVDKALSAAESGDADGRDLARSIATLRELDGRVRC